MGSNITMEGSKSSKQNLALLESNIKNLKAEQTILSRRLAEVDSALRAAEIHHAKIVNQVSTISVIPVELLSAIFEFGKAMTDAKRDEQKFNFDEEDVHPIPFEFLISQINSHFRRVAIKTHQLWTSIRIAPGRPLEYIATYISRSGSCGLNIRVDLDGCVHNPAGVTMTMLDMVLPQSYRWRQLSIVSEREGLDHPMIAVLCNRDAPQIEQLSICVDDVDRPDLGAEERPQVFQRGASRLSFVRLRGIAMHLFRPPLTAVITLHLDQTKALPIRLAKLQEIVTASPVLENLSIYGDIIGTESWPAEISLIPLPSLRSLRLCGVGGHLYSGVLLSFDAPNLESLILKDVQEHDLDRFWESGHVGKFPRMRNLTFCDFDFSDITYKHVFYAFPEITSFSSLYTSANSTPLIKLLVEGSQEQMPWIKLHTLGFLYDSGDDEMLIDLVSRRRALGCPVSKLRLGIILDDLSSERMALEVDEDVAVERLQEIDKWPANRGYPDHDDVLFL